MASMKVRSRRDGSAIPLDDTDKALLNLMQGQFALVRRPYAHVAGLERRFLAPSVSRGRRGRGHQRLFSRCDLVAIRSAHELTRLGVVGTRLRRVCREIRRLERSDTPRMLVLISHAGEARHVPRPRELTSLVQRDDGPYGHVVLDLRRISRDVRRLIRGQLVAAGVRRVRR